MKILSLRLMEKVWFNEKAFCIPIRFSLQRFVNRDVSFVDHIKYFLKKKLCLLYKINCRWKSIFCLFSAIFILYKLTFAVKYVKLYNPKSFKFWCPIVEKLKETWCFCLLSTKLFIIELHVSCRVPRCYVSEWFFLNHEFIIFTSQCFDL